MNFQVFVHDLPHLARSRMAELRRVLEASGNPELLELSREAVEETESPINLVFTGQYNAGKSTLISALTGRDDIVIDSDVATTEVHSYEWGDVTLVDTPGVQAGRREHDEVAETALRDSDLVVFVVSVDLLDDAAVRHLGHVASDLGKRRGMCAVVNKAGTLAAEPDLRVDAVLDALGPGIPVPVVITDARDAIDALDESDPEIREGLNAQANIRGLADALNGLVTRSGQESRLRRPFEKVISLCAAAAELLTDDPAEQAARKVLNRERRLAIASRRRLEMAFDTQFLEYRRDLLNLGEDVADDVEALDSEQDERRRTAAIETLEGEFRQAAEKRTQELIEGLRQAIADEARVAAQELKELSESPQVSYLKEATAAFGPPKADRPRPSAGEQSTEDWSFLRSIGERAGDFAAWWGPQGASKTSAYAGSQGHKTIYSVGKTIGYDFKPWQAARWAKNVGEAAKFINKAAPFVAIGVEAFAAVRADVQEGKRITELQARRRRTLADVERSAAEVEGDTRARLAQDLANFYSPVLQRIEDQQARLDRNQMERDGIRGDLARISSACVDQLSVLDVFEAEDVTGQELPRAH